MLLLGAMGLTAAAPAFAQDPPPPQTPSSAASGGIEYGTANPADTPTVPGSIATIVNGVAYAPADAPEQIKELIWSANKIIGMPYVYGGGHSKFNDKGYDCSGTVSFALHGAGLLAKPKDSSDFFRYGAGGRGSWITVYTASSHAYLTVAGIRLDTSAADDPSGLAGPRWRPLRNTNRNYKTRHPVGF
jgi:hypothetical protein